MLRWRVEQMSAMYCAAEQLVLNAQVVEQMSAMYCLAETATNQASRQSLRRNKTAAYCTSHKGGSVRKDAAPAGRVLALASCKTLAPSLSLSL